MSIVIKMIWLQWGVFSIAITIAPSIATGRYPVDKESVIFLLSSFVPAQQDVELSDVSICASPAYIYRQPMSIASPCLSPAYVYRQHMCIASPCLSPAYVYRQPIYVYRQPMCIASLCVSPAYICVSPAYVYRQPMCIASLCVSSCEGIKIR